MQRIITERQREIAWRIYGEGRSIMDVARAIGVPYLSAWMLTAGRERGYKNYGEYQKDLAKRKGFKNRSEYREDLAKRKGYKSYSEYQKGLAKRKGYKSYSEYREDLAKRRQKRHKNRELSYLIKSRLKEIDRNQSWLAEQIGVSRQGVSYYINGTNIPSSEIMNKLSFALNITKKTLENIVEQD